LIYRLSFAETAVAARNRQTWPEANGNKLVLILNPLALQLKLLYFNLDWYSHNYFTRDFVFSKKTTMIEVYELEQKT